VQITQKKRVHHKTRPWTWRRGRGIGCRGGGTMCSLLAGHLQRPAWEGEGKCSCHTMWSRAHVPHQHCARAYPRAPAQRPSAPPVASTKTVSLTLHTGARVDALSLGQPNTAGSATSAALRQAFRDVRSVPHGPPREGRGFAAQHMIMHINLHCRCSLGEGGCGARRGCRRRT